MVGPERKREAVVHVQHELEVSERRACTSLGQARSTQRYRGRRRERWRRPLCGSWQSDSGSRRQWRMARRGWRWLMLLRLWVGNLIVSLLYFSKAIGITTHVRVMILR